MTLWKKKQKINPVDDLVPVKSKFDAEFRRFSIPKPKSASSCGDAEKDEPNWSFEAFRVLVRKLHRLDDAPFALFYTDPNHGDLLPINNNDNFTLALIKAKTILRLLVIREGADVSPCTPVAKNGCAGGRFPFISERYSGSYCPAANVSIGRPRHFRHISALIDVPDLPHSQRKVRLRKSENDGRPLGVYIRDGWSIRINQQGEPTRIPGVFISRLVAGGLAESTGLLSVNDEILEVNGVFVGEGTKTLDQVTDMMTANAADLIITIRTPDQVQSVINVGDTKRVEDSASPSSTRSNTVRRGASRKKTYWRARKEVSSSVFYLDESDNEDQVIHLRM